jgi:transposase
VASYGPLVSDSAKNLLSLLARQKLLTQRLIDLVSQTQADDLAIITSIDDIGQVSAAHFLAEIGSIGRFEGYQNLIAFCGTDQGIYQSGNSLVSGRITKHGNANLRKYVYLMAEGTLLHNSFFRAYYDKKRTEGFAHRKAMVALMNKLLKTPFALLTKREMFIVPEHSISHSL